MSISRSPTLHEHMEVSNVAGDQQREAEARSEAAARERRRSRRSWRNCGGLLGCPPICCCAADMGDSEDGAPMDDLDEHGRRRQGPGPGTSAGAQEQPQPGAASERPPEPAPDERPPGSSAEARGDASSSDTVMSVPLLVRLFPAFIEPGVWPSEKELSSNYEPTTPLRWLRPAVGNMGNSRLRPVKEEPALSLVEMAAPSTGPSSASDPTSKPRLPIEGRPPTNLTDKPLPSVTRVYPTSKTQITLLPEMPSFKPNGTGLPSEVTLTIKVSRSETSPLLRKLWSLKSSQLKSPSPEAIELAPVKPPSAPSAPSEDAGPGSSCSKKCEDISGPPSDVQTSHPSESPLSGRPSAPTPGKQVRFDTNASVVYEAPPAPSSSSSSSSLSSSGENGRSTSTNDSKADIAGEASNQGGGGSETAPPNGAGDGPSGLPGVAQTADKVNGVVAPAAGKADGADRDRGGDGSDGHASTTAEEEGLDNGRHADDDESSAGGSKMVFFDARLHRAEAADEAPTPDGDGKGGDNDNDNGNGNGTGLEETRRVPGSDKRGGGDGDGDGGPVIVNKPGFVAT
ncbi:hypothetical protein SAMD00023353_0702090 [Rosellinia necatrix]|uniref:Uncharacterized protein n=1 Tax=Rosellinia necatrix TaxID=77044 RepID=A0A1S7UM30_ROSNE|nr:hypothetical protein SAMD00023353_0702090 [Rosellinia necatrix]